MQKIPKIIHYIWLGENPKTKVIKRCMKTWEKHLPGYRIMLWNEDNFDIDAHPYTKEAYKNKKYAYVSDYIRAYALYHYGGVYLDTDVLIIESFDKLLDDRCFVGFENPQYPFTAVWGSEKNHILAKKVLEMYDETKFEYHNDDELKFTNTKTVSDILINEFNVKVDNTNQLLESGIRVYPDYILCNPSNKSVAIHIFTGTWLEKEHSFKRKMVLSLKSHIKNKKTASLYSKLVSKRGT